MISFGSPVHSPDTMATTAPTALPVIHPDTLSFVGLERSHLRSTVYRRVFGDNTGPVRIGRYSLLERVGAGARGVVFKAFDNQLDRLVALKVLSTRADDHEELIREAKALARLSHPNVLPVYEVGETEDGQVFLATEYVKGWTLRGWYDEETRGEAAIVEVIRQVARGVQAAHDEGLVHRDLKPANILLGKDGRARVADFGLARFDPSALAPAAGIPRDGLATTTAGTPGYMAPELFRGAPASAASDQYALAVTLHELLFGTLPDEASSATLRRASKTVSTAMRRALADAPEARFATVGAFADALVSIVRSPLRRRMLWLAGLSALAAIAATVWVTDPVGEVRAENDLVLLRAQAAQPGDPAAALDELRKAPDLSDERLLPTAERALALGPEQARYALPEGAHDIALLGDIILYRDAQDSLAITQLGLEGLESLDPAALGLTVEPQDLFWPDMFQKLGTREATDDVRALASIALPAARRFAARMRAVAISEDGRRVARSSDEGKTLVLEDTVTGEVLWSETRGDSHIGSISLDSTGDRVAWVEGTGNAYIFDISTDLITQLEPLASSVLFEAGGDTVVIQGRFSGVFRTDLARRETTRLLQEDKRFQRVVVSPDGTWLAARDPNDKITVTNLAASVPRIIQGTTFEFSPDGSHLAVVDGHHLEVHDLESSEVQIFTSAGGIASVDFSDARTLWVVGTDGSVRRHDVQATRTFEGHTAPVQDIALSDDGSLALSLAYDFTMRRWDVDSGTGRVLVEFDSTPYKLALDEDAHRIAVTRRRKPTMMFDLQTGARHEDTPGSLARPVVGPKGALFGAGEEGVWRDLAGDTTILASDIGECSSLAATTRWVAAVCKDDDQKLHVWADDGHTSIPIFGSGFGKSLHAWPDADHIYFISDQDQLVRRSDAGDLERLESPRLLGGLEPAVFPAASSRAHDLVVRKLGGVESLWNTTDAPIPLFETSSRTLAISGDGLRVGYATDRHQIIVRDRALSKARPNLAAALDVSAKAQGEH
ncbi:MAG: protein kinase [Nannocystaceae bacterium]|nr:protein kinase [Nannocystaceae bacterium]